MKSYPKYRKSSAFWLGQIPIDWDVLNLKHLARVKNGKDQKEVIVEDGRYPIFGTGGEFGRASAFLYDKPSVLLGRKGTINKPRYVVEPFWSVDTSFYTEINSRVHPKYFYYLSLQIPFDLLQESSAVPSMTQEKLHSVALCRPSWEEQIQITQFLDHQTSIIDQLIRKKESLIEKLKEKWQAIINEAVTKGLDPNAKMKDSGIEWIGRVPTNWKVSFLKRFCKKITDGAHFSPITEFTGKNYVSVKDVDDLGNIDLINCKKISELDFSNLVKSGCQPNLGDVLLTKDGTIGRAAVVKSNNDFVALSSLGIITPNSQLTPEYLRHYLISQINVEQMFSLIAGAALTRLTIEKIKHLIIAIPSITEQIEISNYLSNISCKFQDLFDLEYKEIEKLKEYRQSLISEAVTGKIDVRDWEHIK